jgi:hypothetical protein
LEAAEATLIWAGVASAALVALVVGAAIAGLVADIVAKGVAAAIGATVLVEIEFDSCAQPVVRQTAAHQKPIWYTGGFISVER